MANASSYLFKIMVDDHLVSPAFQRLDSNLAKAGKSDAFKILGDGAAAAGIKIDALGAAIKSALGPAALIFGAFEALSWFKEAATGATDFGNHLYIASRQTGVAADALAKLEYVGKTAGVSTEGVDRAMYRLNLTVQKAALGTDKTAAAMFRGLHIPLKDAQGHMRGITGVLGDLAQAVHAHPAIAQLIAGTAFGSRGAQAMIPVLAEGRDEINRLGDDFERMYGRIDDAQLLAAHKAHEAWERFDTAIDGLKYRLGIALEPSLTYVTNEMTRFLGLIEDAAAHRPGWANATLHVNSNDIGGAINSFDHFGDSLRDAWSASKDLRDVLGEIGSRTWSATIDELSDDLGIHFPASIKTATPAVKDFIGMFEGDFGANLRTLTRIMDLLAASLREVGEVMRYAGQFAHGDFRLPDTKRFENAWKGKKQAPAAAPVPFQYTDEDDVWNIPSWSDFSEHSSTGSKSTIGMRLNNPTNLRSWGKMPTEQTASGRFAVFPTAEAGISAAMGNLLAYGKHGWTSIDKIISHWAPSNENNTRAYINDVSRRSGFPEDQSLDLHDPITDRRLLSAMIYHENGSNPFSQSVLDSGINARLAPPKPGTVNVSVQIEAPRGTTTKLAYDRGDTLGEVNLGRSWLP